MRRTLRGFTLIELMIVVAIIAIIAAIAIPSLLRSRIAANETSAQAALKQIVSTEGVWRQSDSDGNGEQDYWTRDVCGFYGVTDQGGTTLRFIDIAFAQADQNRLGDYPVVGTTASSKSGYWFTAMSTDENGAAYQQQLGTSPGAYTNQSKYGFCAYPASYNITGVRELIVNEMGVIYLSDQGTSTAVVTWPSADPTTAGWVPAQ